MSNILLTYLYDLGQAFETHREMHALSLASYREHLGGVDSFVSLTGKFGGGIGTAKQIRNFRYSQMLVEVFDQVRRLWSDGTSILFVEADTLCVRDTPWPDGNGLRLFNMANARVPGNAYPPHSYLHSGIKLLPQTMDPALWDIGQRMIDEYEVDVWAYDQLVWNRMFWAQAGKRLEDARSYVDPRYCWCVPAEFDNAGVPRRDAYIVHYHGTRGVNRTLRRMIRDA